MSTAVGQELGSSFIDILADDPGGQYQYELKFTEDSKLEAGS